MFKKIILVLLAVLLTACTTNNLDSMTLSDSIDLAMKNSKELYNVNNVGYRYYLPRGFILVENRGSVQILRSNGIEYFLNIDLVSYYNKTEIARNETDEIYEFIDIYKDSKKGFLEIIKNNDYFLVKFVYNYAIIEAQVKENDIKSSVMGMANILSSLKYNNKVIDNKFGEDVLVLQETTYKIFGPHRDEDAKGYAYYLEMYDNYTGQIENKIPDPDIIEQDPEQEQ